ncbi:hypothetical protein M2132_000207 [Dysgonomonas sp. PH5-45]|nr:MULTISPECIES: hypothetical protein [unclassified Dysgonomonas]MDH6353887.1 hypothetical protein [Dysgonomonas sp. PH5-45]MDH6386789.1 hypothetical protein [Dysgonomonas sp. PH5-37]
MGNAVSAVGGLFDIQPNEAEEQPKQPQSRIIKKKKRRGQSPS